MTSVQAYSLPVQTNAAYPGTGRVTMTMIATTTAMK